MRITGIQVIQISTDVSIYGQMFIDLP